MLRNTGLKPTRKAWIVSGLLVLGAVHMLAVSVSPSYAQSARDITNRLSRIENEIDTLSRAVYRGEAPPPGASGGGDPAMAADAQVRIQQLEIELRDLRGKMEEQSFEIRQMKSQLDRALSDMELRLGDMEGAGVSGAAGAAPTRYTASGGTASAGTAAVSESVDSGFNWSSNQASTSGQLGTLTQPAGSGAVSATSTDAAAAAYENAFALLKNAQYDAAEREFQSFITNNPNHILTSNAKYWLGETFYVRGQHEKAARIFAEGYKQYPKGSKAPDNLLKLGMSLAGMGKTADACVALGQLKKEYPAGALPVLRRAEQEMSRLNCV